MKERKEALTKIGRRAPTSNHTFMGDVWAEYSLKCVLLLAAQGRSLISPSSQPQSAVQQPQQPQREAALVQDEGLEERVREGDSPHDVVHPCWGHFAVRFVRDPSQVQVRLVPSVAVVELR